MLNGYRNGLLRWDVQGVQNYSDVIRKKRTTEKNRTKRNREKQSLCFPFPGAPQGIKPKLRKEYKIDSML